jgi:CBS domain-containing protein
MLFLANVLGRPVCGKDGQPIGKLDDLIVRIGDTNYPPITGLVVKDRQRRFFVPATNLAELNGSAKLATSTVDLQPFRRRDGEVLLYTDVLDHQIIDITGRRIVRVNDVQLAPVDDSYRIVGVDVSPQALLRRLAPRSLAAQIVGRQMINWEDVQYLASAAPVQLKMSYDRLAELNPVDLARIVDALSYRDSAEIVAALDDETAAETLEEVSDERLADILEGMDSERAADILEEMTPSAAADALEDLDTEFAEEILALMEPEEAAEVQELLAYDEDSAGRIMSTDFIGLPEGLSIGEAVQLLRSLDDLPDPLLAIYVVAHEPHDQPDTPPRLRGLLRLRQLITGQPDMLLSEVMEEDIPTVYADDKAERAAQILAEYNLLAVPVVDDHERMIGVVSVDDALAVLLPEIWQNRSTGVFR